MKTEFDVLVVADGDVSGALVYVNQGLPRDYEELARHDIDAIDSAIALLRTP